MLSFYTGHLSNGGDGAQSAVSLLRNEMLDNVKNDIVDSDGGVTTTNGRVRLNRRLLADPTGEGAMHLIGCRPKGGDCTQYAGTIFEAFCEGLNECQGCMKDSDCDEGSCTNTGPDLESPNSIYTMCVIPKNCRAANGRPPVVGYSTCDAVADFEPMPGSDYDGDYYNKDCCGNKKCIIMPAAPPFARPPTPQYNYCGDVCIMKKNCDQDSAHSQEAQCGDGDGDFACCSDDVRERDWKDGNGDKCERRAGACNPGTEQRPNCDCAPVGGVCRLGCPIERALCEFPAWGFPVCPLGVCCVGRSTCNPIFEDVYE